MNSLLFGIEEQSDFADWVYVSKNKDEFDNEIPMNNECFVYSDNDVVSFKINTRETVKYYYKNKVTNRLLTVLGKFDNNDFLNKFLDNNIASNTNISKTGILSKSTPAFGYISTNNLSEAINDKFREDKTATSKFTDTNTMVFTISNRNKTFLPYINFGK
jgi:hypothetical protein